MPYAPGFTRALRGISHGWKPKRGSLQHISQGKAKGMLDEASKTRKAKHRAQIKAVRSMSGANG